MVEIAKCFAGKGLNFFIFLGYSRKVHAHLVRCGAVRVGFFGGLGEDDWFCRFSGGFCFFGWIAGVFSLHFMGLRP